MSAARGYFHPALRVFLADYVGEIHLRRRTLSFLRDCAGHTIVLSFDCPGEDLDNFSHAAHSVDTHAVQLGGLHRGVIGEDTAFEIRLAGQLRCGEAARDASHRAVQPKLAHQQILVQTRHPSLLGRGDYSYRYRQVITGSVLLSVRRGQVDNYLLPGDVIPQALQGSHRAEKALLHGGVRQPAQMHPYPQGYVHLHRHADGVYTYAFGSIYMCQHFFLIFVPAGSDPAGLK